MPAHKQKQLESLITEISKESSFRLKNEDFDVLKLYHIANSKRGDLMGEIAMLNHDNPLKNKRALSCVVKSEFAILLGLDVNVFNILVREKQKKQVE